MAEEQQPWAIWLGIGASAVAVLAFFGITSFDDLRSAVSSASSDSTDQACDKVGNAVRLRADLPGARGKRIYAQKLRAAAKIAEDGKLKAYFEEDAEISQQSADGGDLPNTILARQVAAYNGWVGICNTR